MSKASKTLVSRSVVSKSLVSKGILVAGAMSLAFGAVAWGRDLSGSTQGVASGEAIINRAAKSDRTAAAVPADMPMRTISMRLQSLNDTSVAIRLPVPMEARSAPPVSIAPKSDGRRPTVACEPPVSMLTEVAKLLQPGRCVT